MLKFGNKSNGAKPKTMEQQHGKKEKNMKGANKIVYIKTINVHIPPRTRMGSTNDIEDLFPAYDFTCCRHSMRTHTHIIITDPQIAISSMWRRITKAAINDDENVRAASFGRPPLPKKKTINFHARRKCDRTKYIMIEKRNRWEFHLANNFHKLVEYLRSIAASRSTNILFAFAKSIHLQTPN